MKRKIYCTLFTCVIVVLLFLLADKLPAFIADLLAPGFYLAAIINGSFHDRVIRGYLILGVFFNCIFYSMLVLLCCWLFGKLRSQN